MAEDEERVIDNPETDFEPRDVSLGFVGIIALITLALLILTPFVLRAGYFGSLADANRKATMQPPGPALQTDAAADLRAFNAEERAQLGSYGWVDRSKGIVHIPIRQAMKDLVAKGIPGFPKPPSSPPG